MAKIRKILGIAAICTVALINHAGAQVTLVRQPLWMAGASDCNHAIYNNMSSPCSDSSPTGSNDSEYVSYFQGLVFQPRISGAPSYFTQNGDFVVQGKTSFSNSVEIGTTQPGGVIFTTTNIDPRGYTLPNLANSAKMLIGWNRSQGGGEIDFIANRGGGGPGGYSFYDYTNAGVVNNLMALRPVDTGAMLEVNGSVKLASGSGASIVFSDNSVQSVAWTGVLTGGDYAESVDVVGERVQYQPGDLLAIDVEHPDKFLKSSKPYSQMIAGVYSTKPGVTGRRMTTVKSAEEIPMAITGIVPTKVSAENGAIKPGDLLVSSSSAGYAMRGTVRKKMMGAVIGKAMGNLATGKGVIEVLVYLQ